MGDTSSGDEYEQTAFDRFWPFAVIGVVAIAAAGFLYASWVGETPTFGRRSSDAQPTQVQADEPTPRCLAAMRSMADGLNTATDREYAAMSTTTLSVCGDAPMWLEAARRYPLSVGVVDAVYVDVIHLQSHCFDAQHSPVCASAYELGWFVRPS